jgi:hypothetical protein
MWKEDVMAKSGPASYLSRVTEERKRNGSFRTPSFQIYTHLNLDPPIQKTANPSTAMINAYENGINCWTFYTGTKLLHWKGHNSARLTNWQTVHTARDVTYFQADSYSAARNTRKPHLRKLPSDILHSFPLLA